MEPLLDENCKTAEPSNGPSLLDLPDELVTLIFRVVYLLERDEKRTGTAVSLNGIRVNKRIYALAVKSIHIQSAVPYPNLLASALGSFTTLESLELETNSMISASITKISKLESLHSLSLTGSTTFEDRSFALSNSSIRQLSGTTSGALQQLLESGTASTLEVLELRTSDLQAQRMDAAFAAASNNEQPLSCSRFGHFEFIFDFLRRAKPKHIKLSHISEFPFLRTKEVFPFVRYLELQGSAQVSPTDNLEALHSLLSRFPSLEHLTLTTLRFNSTRTSLVSDYTKLSYAAFVMSYPIFTALLTVLRTTTILHFEYEPPTDLLKLRGTRASTDEDLGVEVIRMLRK
ncbi:hypothetical protein JCM10449v2_005672 [Rhodotorula kratochvilovae]